MSRRPAGRLSRFSLLITATTIVLALGASASAQTIRGRVVDPDQRPVPRAGVLVVQHGSVAASLETAADGTFGPIELPAGEYELLVAAAGLRAEPARVRLEPNATRDLQIRTTLTAVKESIVVSAAQVDLPLSHVTDAVTVIDRAEIELKQTDSVADALRVVPGFGVVASGGRGAITSIFPRGGESDYTLVLVDGIPQNAFGGGFDAAHLDTVDVDRIEVVRGPASALYGSGAIGGIVQVVTRAGGAPRAAASFEGGGYGFNRASASTSGSRGPWIWGAGFDRLTTDGDTRIDATLQQRISNDDYERTVGSGTFGWSNERDASVRVHVRGGRDLRGYPGPYGSDPSQLYSGLDLVSHGHNTSREVSAVGSFGAPARLRQRVQFTWAGLKSAYTSPYGQTDDRTRRATGRYQLDRDFRHTGLSAGAEVLNERVDNTFITGAAFQPVPVSRLMSGFFVEARPSVGARAFLTVGARLERIERRALERDPSAFNDRPAFDEEVVWSLNPKLSAAWWIRPPDANGWTKLRGSVGTGIKPPTGFEIAYTNNPDLKPERNRSFDVGIEQALAGTALVAEANWFSNRYDDLIASVGSSFAGPNPFRTDNIANASARGLEAGARWRGRRGLGARTAWTFQHTEVLGLDPAPNIAPEPYRVGNPLVRRPAVQGFGELSWMTARGNGFVSVGGRGEVTDLEPNYGSSIFTNPGYAAVAFGGAITIRRQFNVFVRVDNAFDRQYEEVLGYPALGRTALVGIRVAAGR